MQLLKSLIIVLIFFPNLNSFGQWTEINAPSAIIEIEQSGNQLFARTSDYLFHSSNQGQTWDTVQIGLQTGFINDLSIDDDTLYLACRRGVVYSIDGGNSFNWQLEWPWDASLSVDVHAGYGWLAITSWGDSSGPNKKEPNTGWRLSRGSGINWGDMSMNHAVADPIASSRVAYLSGVSSYMTSDSGLTWQASPRVLDAVEFNGQTYAFSQDQYSSDLGNSWQTLQLTGRAFMTNPKNGALLMAHTNKGIYQGTPDDLAFIGLGNHQIIDFASGDSVLYALTNTSRVFALKWSNIFLISPYYHAFQNYDDDVFRTRTYSNLWGGNSGIGDGDSTKSQITSRYSTLVTRTGYGRSKAISYGPLTNWSIYLESIIQNWTDNTQSFNLNNLFPDFLNPALQFRHIDSLVFYTRLDSTQDTLTLNLELQDVIGGKSAYQIDILPDSNWHKISVALNQFQGTFDPTKAKFIGMTFDEALDNDDESGLLYVDDFYWVERSYQKPSFTNPDDMLAYINEVSFRHFWMSVDPVSKFAWDRHIWNDLISVDAIGFQLSSYVIAHQNQWVPRDSIEKRVEHILHYLLNRCQHAADSSMVKANPLQYATVDGNWAHFLDNNTLARKDTTTEFSLFSNCLLIAGIHSAQKYFNTISAIDQKADSLIRMTNWNFLYRPNDGLMYYDWKPESGFSQYYTDFFTEELDLAFLLGVSTPEPSHRLPQNPYCNSGYRKFVCFPQSPQQYIYSAPGASFTYFFLQMYGRFDPSSERFINTQNALIEDKRYSQLKLNYLNYDPRIWGQTALEAADSSGYDPILGNISNYHAFGAGCRFDTHNGPNGTIAIYGGASGILHTTNSSIELIDYYYNELDSLFRTTYEYEFWSPIFGFPDGFHLDPETSTDSSINILDYNGPWISVPRFGIDIGPMLMNIDSYLKEKQNQSSIRDMFSMHPYLIAELDTFENIFDKTVGIEEEHFSQFNIFPNPNPNSGRFSINFFSPTTEIVQINILNLTGKNLKQKSAWASVGMNHQDIELLELAKGIYLLQLKSEMGIITRKIIIE